MMMLPVHCCCTPDKRLGWVPVRELGRIGPIRFVTERPLWILGPNDEPRFSPPRYIEAAIDRLTLTRGETIWAVNSNDHPIEEWRKVRGFIEDCEQQQWWDVDNK